MDHEYKAYGYDFPSPKIRIEQMVEGIKIVMKAMWTGSGRLLRGQVLHDRGRRLHPSPSPRRS
ncbi:MAG: hypothetical protein U0232_20485 [Thermomicrobiales bacterium]